MAIDRAAPGKYPPNIQAVMRRTAPAASVLGQELLEVNGEKGCVTVAYNTGEALSNRYGAIHGGMTAAMLDDVMSLAAGLTIEWGQITPTLEMKVSYIKQGVPGARLIATAKTVRRGASIVFLEADLKSEDGSLVATASSTIAITTLKR
jgi:uncharacterized protein (TIGR00369 family)